MPSAINTSALSKPLPPTSLPTPPLPWIWQCHSCLHLYRFAAVSRCLTCSHRFCTSCESALDYEGWSRWESAVQQHPTKAVSPCSTSPTSMEDVFSIRGDRTMEEVWWAEMKGARREVGIRGRSVCEEDEGFALWVKWEEREAGKC